MRTKTIIDTVSGNRVDHEEYPIEAVRELVLNALIHRDYSIHTQGMPIQVQMFSDRLVITNPGGLYGRLTVDQLGRVQPDTRNPVIATAMELLKQTENRYSGIPTVRRLVAEAGMPEPEFENRRGEFRVTLRLNAQDHADGKDGAELDDHEEHVPEVLGDVQREELVEQQHVTGRGDGQPLGNALHNTHQDRFDDLEKRNKSLLQHPVGCVVFSKAVPVYHTMSRCAYRL